MRRLLFVLLATAFLGGAVGVSVTPAHAGDDMWDARDGGANCTGFCG
jgi:Spy/CpxP family protein refolding chaperone